MSEKNIVLCIDTSAESCTVGLVSYTSSKTPYTASDITVIADISTPMTRGHAEHIMPNIANILKLSDVTVSELSAVAVTIGPGAFTGIRIGLSTAKGLCLPDKIPCIGVCNAHAVAQQVNVSNCTVLLETKRSDYYVSQFKNGKITSHQSLPFNDAVSIIDNAPITGDGSIRFIQQWHAEKPNTPAPVVLDSTQPLTITAIVLSALNAPQQPAPTYVRAPDVQPPKSGLVPQNSLQRKIGKKG